jgi:hypothetical protein
MCELSVKELLIPGGRKGLCLLLYGFEICGTGSYTETEGTSSYGIYCYASLAARENIILFNSSG